MPQNNEEKHERKIFYVLIYFEQETIQLFRRTYSSLIKEFISCKLYI